MFSIWSGMRSSPSPESGRCDCAPALTVPQLAQKLVRGDEERVLLEDAAEDNHRVSPHDVDDDIGPELGEIVHADDRVSIVAGQKIVQPGLVLDQVIHARSV